LSMMYDIIKKLALFSLVWGFVMTGSALDSWEMAGPTWRSIAFQASQEVRKEIVASAPGVNNIACLGTGGSGGIVIKEESLPMSEREYENFILQTSTMACIVERSHMIGIASRLAIAKSSIAADSFFGFGMMFVKLLT